MPSEASSAVPGQFLGYSYQVTRMLEHLLVASPGSTVSLEVIGDTSVQGPDGLGVVEEAKSSTSGANPASDRSIQLWKTFRNWRRLLNEGLVGEGWVFRLHILQPFEANIAQSFSDASDDESARAAINEAQTALGWEGVGTSRSLGEYLDEVFAEPLEELIGIVRSFSFTHGNGRSIQELSGLFEEKLVPPELTESVLNGTLGWLKGRVDSAIEEGLPATISFEEFRSEVLALIRKLDRAQILLNVAPAPSRETISDELTARVYIRQLELIGEHYDGLILAASQFLRARANRVRWAQDSRVHQSSFDELEDDLKGAWENYRRQVSIRDADRSKEDRGRLLYSECQGHQCPVQGMSPPPHFIPGCFHGLADELLIGWHPDYNSELS